MNRFVFYLLLASAAIGQTIPEAGYVVVNTYPHDPQAFTEGLFYLDGNLYEGTGLAGKSSIRRVKLETGQVLQERALDAPNFGEGIVAWRGHLIELTYTSEIAFVYNLKTFQPEKSFHYAGQGWSLTQDGKRIIMDDGTPVIRFWAPETFKQIGQLTVTANGVPLQYINELEWVKGEIFANVWHTNRIARIDPVSGKVKGWINLEGLLDPKDVVAGPDGGEQVLNGIAYDAKGDRLFVTGKYWPKLYEIRPTGPTPRPSHK